MGGTEGGEVGGWEVERGRGWRGFERVVDGDGVIGVEVSPDQTKVCKYVYYDLYIFLSKNLFIYFFFPRFVLSTPPEKYKYSLKKDNIYLLPPPIKC